MVSLGFRKLSWIRDHQTVPKTFFSASLALKRALELLLGPTTELVVTSCCVKSNFSLHVTIQSRNGSLLLHIRRQHFQTRIFLISSQLLRHRLVKPFHLSNLLQMPKDHRIANVEFLGNFSCSFQRISLMMALNWSLSTFNGQSLYSSSLKLSSPWQHFLNHCCTMFISSSWAKRHELSVSIPLQPILKSKKKIT